jgi:hypothetical protein
MLYLAAALIIATGIIHSTLGERLIIIPVLKLENLPVIFGSTAFVKGTLRFVWHLISIAWWTFAYFLILAANNSINQTVVLNTICVVAFISSIFPLVLTRGKHYSWVVLFLVFALIAATLLQSST